MYQLLNFYNVTSEVKLREDLVHWKLQLSTKAITLKFCAIQRTNTSDSSNGIRHRHKTCFMKKKNNHCS